MRNDGRVESVMGLGVALLDGMDPEGLLADGIPSKVVLSVRDGVLTWRADLSFASGDVLSVKGVMKQDGLFAVAGLSFRTPPWKDEPLPFTEGASSVGLAVEGWDDVPVLRRIIGVPSPRSSRNVSFRVWSGFKAARSAVLWDMDTSDRPGLFDRFCVEYTADGARVMASADLPAARLVVSSSVSELGLDDRMVVLQAGVGDGVVEARCFSPEGRPSVRCAMELERKLRDGGEPEQRRMRKSISKEGL